MDGIPINARNCVCWADLWWIQIECSHTIPHEDHMHT